MKQKKVLLGFAMLIAVAGSARPILGTYNGSTKKPNGTLVIKCLTSSYKCVEVKKWDDTDVMDSITIFNPDGTIVDEILGTSVVEQPSEDGTGIDVIVILP